MNALDIGMIVILFIFAIIGYRRGLVHTVYRFISFFAALFLAVRLHPYVSRALRDSFVYDGIRGRIADSANLEAAFREHAPSPGIGIAFQDRNTIDALPVPGPLRELLYNNNTPAVRDVLRVGTLEDFIAGFLANIVINAISLLLVFVAVLLLLKLIGSALHIVDNLPVISSVNRLGGFVIGAVLGAGVVWLGLVVVTIFFSTISNEIAYELIQGSSVTGWLLENGWLLAGMTAV
ncbi:MAG: CvpA family protein [Defluviitaleaceae bacterium]|nr:CvpA family protein [Defluviitaleaceae bacterium]